MIENIKTGSGVFLSVTSIVSLIASSFTRGNISWFIGILSALSALVMLYLSYKRHIREELQSVERNKVLEAQLKYLKKKTELLGIDSEITFGDDE